MEHCLWSADILSAVHGRPARSFTRSLPQAVLYRERFSADSV